MTKKSKAKLALEVYRLAYDETESFEKGNVGPDLAYVMGTILEDDVTVLRTGSRLLKILRGGFPEGHEVWKHVMESNSDCFDAIRNADRRA